jgi:putative transposase
LWQERFASFVMDYRHTLAAVRYIELNPVRAGLVAQAGEYPWSSARAHLTGTNDLLVNVVPLCSEIEDWEAYLCLDEEEATLAQLRSCERTGRPCGDTTFISQVESLCGRILHRQKPGPKGNRDAK